MDDLPQRPRIRGYLRASPTADGELVVRGGATQATLRGRSVSDLLPYLLPKLDGRRRLADIVAELDHVDNDVVIGALQILMRANLLEDAVDEFGDVADGDGPISVSISQRNYWNSLGANSADIQQRLQMATVAVVGDSGDMRLSLAETLARAGVGKLVFAGGSALDAERENRCDTPERPDASESIATVEEAVSRYRCDIERVVGGWARLRDRIQQGVSLVVTCTDGTNSDLDGLNRFCVGEGIKWLHTGLGDQHGVIGPFVIPRQSACYECFQLRLASNRSFVLDAHGRAGVPPEWGVLRAPEPAHASYFAALVGCNAGAEVIRSLTGVARPTTIGAFLSLRPDDALIVRHDVLRIPRCSVCGPRRYRPQMKVWDIDNSGEDDSSTGAS